MATSSTAGRHRCGLRHRRGFMRRTLTPAADQTLMAARLTRLMARSADTARCVRVPRQARALREHVGASPEGFEPSTYRLEGGCSIH
jgi:hypothetical protein